MAAELTSPQVPKPHSRRGWTKTEKRELAKGLLFISPAIVGFICFAAYPIVQSFYYSFTDYNVLQAPTWSGADNYSALFRDRLFVLSLRNTLYMVVVGLPIHLTFDLLMALLLNTKIRGLSLYRTLFYLPSITPVVASAVLWLWIFNAQYGLLNTVISALGFPTVGWLTDPSWTKPSLIFMGIWAGGNTILIYLASLQDVPVELMEAAELDGAGSWSRARNIVLPMISPAIFYTLVINLIGYFQYFTEAWVMTAARDGSAGGPSNSLMFYAMYLYQNAFQFFKMGYASAQAWILFAIVLLATLVLFRSSGWVYYRGEK